MARHDPSTILSALRDAERAGTSDPDKAAHRRYRRFVVREDAELQPIDVGPGSSAAVPIHLRDVSRTGVGFIVTEPLLMHSVWRLFLLNRGYPVGHQPITVQNITQLNESAYLVGAQFCIETGLLCLLGIDPRDVDENGDDGDESFLPPAEVAVATDTDRF